MWRKKSRPVLEKLKLVFPELLEVVKEGTNQVGVEGSVCNKTDFSEPSENENVLGSSTLHENHWTFFQRGDSRL